MNTNSIQSLEAAENIGIYLRVRLNDSAPPKLVVCSAALTAECIGHNAYDEVDYDQAGRNIAAVQIKNPGTQVYAVASGAILAGAEFKAADNGKIQTIGATGSAEGRALKAASGDGSIIPVIYYTAPITRS